MDAETIIELEEYLREIVRLRDALSSVDHMLLQRYFAEDVQEIREFIRRTLDGITDTAATTALGEGEHER